MIGLQGINRRPEGGGGCLYQRGRGRLGDQLWRTAHQRAAEAFGGEAEAQCALVPARGSRLKQDEDPEQAEGRLAFGNICEWASQVECAQVGKQDLPSELEATCVPERSHQRAA